MEKKSEKAVGECDCWLYCLLERLNTEPDMGEQSVGMVGKSVKAASIEIGEISRKSGWRMRLLVSYIAC